MLFGGFVFYFLVRDNEYMSYIFYAFLSAITAAFVAILGKLGLKNVDTTLATTVRSVVMAFFLISTSVILKKFNGFSLSSFSQRDWLLIICSGIVGALSWLFYFFALKTVVASHVSAIDRLSVVFVVILSVLFLGEVFTWKSLCGALFIVVGALLITWK